MLRWLLHRLSLSLLLLLLWRRHGSYPSAQPAHVACMERSIARWVGWGVPWVSKPRGCGQINLELGFAKLGEFCKPTSN